jgi:Holliday junction resolvase RusA-like endonuclease
MRIELPIEPTACPRPKVTKYGTYYPKKYKDFLRKAKFALAGIQPCNELQICFVIKRPKAMKKGGRIAHTKKPDLDNLIKSVLDALPFDDKIVHSIRAFKVYAAHDEYPSIIITIPDE